MKPRTRIDLAILAVLEAGPIHGWALFETVRTYQPRLLDRSSTLYLRLFTLKADGVVETREERCGDEIQVIYTLTPYGHDHLKALRADLNRYLWVLGPVVQKNTSKRSRVQQRSSASV